MNVVNYTRQSDIAIRCDVVRDYAELGYFELFQKIPNDQLMRIEVWNAVGNRIYNDFVIFNNGIVNLLMANKIPGLYLMKITEENGYSGNLKFVIE